eukprot:508863_1
MDKDGIDKDNKLSSTRRKRGPPPKPKYNNNNADGDSGNDYEIQSKRQKLNDKDINNNNTYDGPRCKICNINTTNNAGLSNHIRARHAMQKLDDYYDLNDKDIKVKQNEMYVNDKNALIGKFEISATHKSKNIKYKYKCTICDNNNKLFYCAGHVGLNSHLRAHVKNGTLQDNKQKQLYKRIIKQKIPINNDRIDKDDVSSDQLDDNSSVISNENNKKRFQLPKNIRILKLSENKLSETTPPCSEGSNSSHVSNVSNNNNNNINNNTNKSNKPNTVKITTKPSNSSSTYYIPPSYDTSIQFPSSSYNINKSNH